MTKDDAIKAIEAEYLLEDTGTESDLGYTAGLDAAIEAIRALPDAGWRDASESDAIVAWLRADEKGRGLVDYRHCWNIAAMIERGEHLPPPPEKA